MRDLLSWVHFMNKTSPPLSPMEAFYHGAHLACLDGLGCSGQLSSVERVGALAAAETFLRDLLLYNGCDVPPVGCSVDIRVDDSHFGIHPFFIRKGSYTLFKRILFT